MNIYEKLLYIQTNLKAPKNQFNKFGNYKYRNCEDILEAVKPIQQQVKAVTILTDEIVHIGERYYVKATARLIDTENGEKIENTAFAREEETKKGMDGSQITGSSSSYARKYALNGLFDIDDTKDSDYTNIISNEIKDNKDEEMEKELAKKITEKEAEMMIFILEKKGKTKEDFIAWYNTNYHTDYKEISEMTKQDYGNTMLILNKTGKKK